MNFPGARKIVLHLDSDASSPRERGKQVPRAATAMVISREGDDSARHRVMTRRGGRFPGADSVRGFSRGWLRGGLPLVDRQSEAVRILEILTNAERKRESPGKREAQLREEIVFLARVCVMLSRAERCNALYRGFFADT